MRVKLPFKAQKVTLIHKMSRTEADWEIYLVEILVKYIYCGIFDSFIPRGDAGFKTERK